MQLPIGTILKERYRVDALLGEGGFGAVYKAWDLSLEGAVAIKESTQLNKASRKQFQLEARLLFKLHHPNLPRVIDFFSLKGQGQYLVMDFIEGEDLDSMMQRTGRPLPLDRVLAWTSQICQALDFLHAQKPPIIHRDIKPSNIRIMPSPLPRDEPYGRALLVDFGIAKLLQGAERTATGARAVTPGYSPPEQYGIGNTEARSDIYALAATLYHLLTGKIPTPARERMLADCDPIPLAHTLNSTLPAGLSEVLEWGMNLEKEKRPTKALDFLEAFTAAAGIHQPGSPPPSASPGQPSPVEAKTTLPLEAPTESEQAGKPGRKSPSPWWIGAGVVILVLALFTCGVLNRLSNRLENQRTTGTAHSLATITALTTLAGTPVDDALPATTPIIPSETAILPENLDQLQILREDDLEDIRRLDISPNQDTLVAVGKSHLYFLSYPEIEVRQVITSAVELYEAAISPSGERVAVGADDASVTVWESRSGESVIRLRGHEGSVYAVAYSPDGELIASGSKDRTVRLWRASDGARLRTLLGHRSAVTRLAVSPDGSLLASGSGDGEVRIWELPSGDPLTRFQAHAGIVSSLIFSPDGAWLVTAAEDGQIKLFERETFAEKFAFNDTPAAITKLTINPSSSLLAASTAEGDILVYNMSTMNPLTKLGYAFTFFTDLTFSPDGRYLLGCGRSHLIIVWGISVSE